MMKENNNKNQETKATSNKHGSDKHQSRDSSVVYVKERESEFESSRERERKPSNRTDFFSRRTRARKALAKKENGLAMERTNPFFFTTCTVVLDDEWPSCPVAPLSCTLLLSPLLLVDCHYTDRTGILY
jgi:hypothetical protein